MSKFVCFELVPYEVSKSFGINKENRVLNRGHVERIKRQFLNSYDTMPAITVNTVTRHIIDGQHRCTAWWDLYKSGQLPSDSLLKVMYVEIPVEKEREAIIDANTNSKNWSLDDYINSYIKQNIISYVKLDEWCKSHSLSSDSGKSKYRYGSAMMTGKRCSNDLKNGLFTFTEEELQRADEVHAELLEIVELLEMKGKGNWIESLAVSWITVRTQHDFRTWIKEFKAKKQSLLKLPKDNSKDWENIFAQVHLAIDKKNGK